MDDSDLFDADLPDAEAVAARRDDLVARVREHAGRIARDLARLSGSDYGRRRYDTDAGTWTVKWEDGGLEFLLFDGSVETYVVSTKRDPDPEALADALADYPAFLDAHADYVRSLEDLFDDVPAFPEVASTESVVAERDRIHERLREVADTMAGELHRYEGSDYGTFTARVGGARWELKREHGTASYLRVGGSDGDYLLSQYGPPSAAELREWVDDVPEFVAAYNDHVRALELDLLEVEFVESRNR